MRSSKAISGSQWKHAAKSNKPRLQQTLLVKVIAANLALAALASANVLAEGKSVALEEIVVTVRKVQENLQDTPVAVSAFSEAAMERRMLVTTEDLSRVTPNLQFKSYSPLSGNSSAAQVFIRGIGQSDASGGVDPGVGLYIDGVYMGRSVGGVMDFRDIANVQILRGPQGTLFGRNTIGGAVILTTQKPGDEFSGKVKVGVGDEGLFETFAALDLPITDTVAARLSIGARQRDGYVERIYDGLDLGNEDSYTVNGSLFWNATDEITVALRADYTEEDENGSPFVFAAINENAAFPAYQSVTAGCPGATFPPPSVPSGVVDQRCANNATWDLGEYTNGGNTKAESNTENQGFSVTVDWQANEALALKYIGADRKLDWFGSRDADNTYLTILSTQYDSTADQTSHEIQATYQVASLNAVAGIFSFDEDIRDFLLVPFGPPGVPAGIVPVDYQLANLENESIAYYTNWTFDLSETWSLSAGARYTEEDKSMRLIATSAGVVPLPVPETLSFDTPAPPYNVPVGPHKQNFDATTFSLSTQYRFNENLMTYLSWSEGFKSGGFNQRYNAPPPGGDPVGFDSEEATTYELGIKADVGDNLRVNAALFKTDYENMQLTYRVGIVPILFNAGESSISGAEVEFTYAPGEALIIEGSLGYLDDEIDSVSEIPGAEATLGPESDLPFTPEISASLGASYSVYFSGFELTPRLDLAYTSSQYFDAANTEEVAQTDGETVTNLSFRFADAADSWSLVAGVENLTDETYAIAGNSSLSTGSGYAEVIYSRPRSYYLSVSYNF
ncbi:TonB-dependent receptor [Halioxenophilus sp. WMMB6]|uniref:TonB-dependent receptor n=1 Tax=Halioxenophilus sp. WMMB6 TaxID=3073815 RepID=UPI00295F5434|nr:TonB-dependent receptor [Halioxenophilus sp. WMMB6]